MKEYDTDYLLCGKEEEWWPGVDVETSREVEIRR
jgi:hypothetical protein